MLLSLLNLCMFCDVQWSLYYTLDEDVLEGRKLFIGNITYHVLRSVLVLVFLLCSLPPHSPPLCLFPSWPSSALSQCLLLLHWASAAFLIALPALISSHCSVPTLMPSHRLPLPPSRLVRESWKIYSQSSVHWRMSASQVRLMTESQCYGACICLYSLPLCPSSSLIITIKITTLHGV